jgi:hypothetical protein
MGSSWRIRATVAHEKKECIDLVMMSCKLLASRNADLLFVEAKESKDRGSGRSGPESRQGRYRWQG